ncbi:MAG: NAD(P)H-dependent oxidoreductase [Methanomassiliicoccus sp.]|nr:NAD(P)H-dependent oxidoreductase [Methanomassiliicoccus sp.]
MRVLVIMGSPRRNGTGTEVARMIGERLRWRGSVEVEMLHLADTSLRSCCGCFSCIKQGEDRCPFKEERIAIEERIEAADGIVLISPGYVQNVSALMKNFMDRMAYTNHRPRFFQKKTMIVANGGAGLDKTLDALRIAIGGPEVVSELAYLQLPWQIRPQAREKRKRALVRATDRFYDALVRRDMRPSFGNYMRFRFFKSASEAAKEHLPADYAYYRDLGRYYYEVKVGAGTRLMAAITMAIALPMMKDMAPWPGEE